MYSTVSHRHVYGLLFRVLWPLLTRRSFAAYNFEYPEQLVGSVGAGHALVTSPALLRRIGYLRDAEGRWLLIFSSGGLLPGDAAVDATRVFQTCPIEVLGSTETSGVAWRRQRDKSARWTPFPQAEVRASEDGFLEVLSPYSGFSDWYRMGDLIRQDVSGSFELLGRGDRIAKIEDQRVSLTEIERRLLELQDVDEAAVVALVDGSRQMIGIAVRLSSGGRDCLQRVGRRGYSRSLHDHLGQWFEPVVLPKKFRFVDELPVDIQGKRTQAAISRLFDES